MDPLVALVLAAIAIAVLMTGHLAWLDKVKARRNARRLADKYGQPHHRPEER